MATKPLRRYRPSGGYRLGFVSVALVVAASFLVDCDVTLWRQASYASLASSTVRTEIDTPTTDNGLLDEPKSILVSSDATVSRSDEAGAKIHMPGKTGAMNSMPTAPVDVDESIEFDPSMTLNEYTQWARQQHIHPKFLAPSPKWLDQCVSVVENNTALFQPWNNFDKHYQTMDRLSVVYRLADCMRFCAQCINKGRIKQSIKEISLYYGEMACDTMEEPARYENYDVIEKIFHLVENDTNRTGEFVKPDPDAVIIHARLGDVMECGHKVDGSATVGSASYFLAHGGIGAHPSYRDDISKARSNETATVHYQKSIFSVQDYLNALQEAGATKVVIVGGSHKKKHYQKSKPYGYCLANGLAFAGLEVELRLDQEKRPRHPDADFYYMSHAKQFILSAGGFSNIIGHMVAHLGGQVLQSGKLLPLSELPKLKKEKKTREERIEARKKAGGRGAPTCM